LSSADGDGDVDHDVADVTAKIFKQSCKFHKLIIDETTIVLLDSLAGSHSNRIKIKFLSASDRVTHRRSSNLIDLIEKWN
jgi:hypothetical protein